MADNAHGSDDGIAHLVPWGDELLAPLTFERIPDKSEEWVLNHVRADKVVFTKEIEAAGFQLVEEVLIPGLKENYFLRFIKL